MTNMKQSIGIRVKRLREARKLTQAGLAEQCGMSTRSISNIECGGNYPSFENLIAIADVLECQLSDIIDKPVKGKARLRLDNEAKLIATIKSLSNEKIDLAAKLLSTLK